MSHLGGIGISNPISQCGMLTDCFLTLHSSQHVYPDLADAVQVTSHADAWTLGDAAVIVPANGIAVPFSIRFVSISSISANDQYQLELYENGHVVQLTFVKSATVDPAVPLPVTSRVLAANTQITAKLANQTAAQSRTCDIKIWYVEHG